MFFHITCTWAPKYARTSLTYLLWTPVYHVHVGVYKLDNLDESACRHRFAQFLSFYDVHLLVTILYIHKTQCGSCPIHIKIK